MTLWVDTRPTVAAHGSYADRLKTAIDRSGISVREVAKRLSGATGNPIDDERSAIYRYMKETEPASDRAVILAAILGAPELIEVTPLSEKRRSRLAKLEAEVATLRAERDFALREVVARLGALEAAQGKQGQQEDQRSNTEK